MHKPFRIWRGAILPIVLSVAVAASPVGAAGSDEKGASLPGGEASSDAPSVPLASDLNQLLDAADKDVGTLAKVSVAAPALQSEVSTVARQESTVGRSPAAVYVVTNEMIRRSGARTIPDVLRLVPGVNVSQIDGNKWAVSIRGFNGRFANKLLVQIDGRSVYSPLFGGVWWDVQDVVLEDVERIEVIRGPGAAVWGANAVNGIINIITKKAAETQGAMVQTGGGSHERWFTTARYGGQLGSAGHYRVYGKTFDRAATVSPAETACDDWHQGRAGFRADWGSPQADFVTLQGEAYAGKSGAFDSMPSLTPPRFSQSYPEDHAVDGQNLLFRWQHTIDDESDWSAQFFYDHTNREWVHNGFAEDRGTLDLDFQHRFPLAERHGLIWGVGYRNTRDRLTNSSLLLGTEPLISFPISRRADDLFSCFVQDEITLLEDRLFFIAGSKLEWNDYTGFEFQPTGRLLWTPTEQCSLWTSISRAVRTPTRGEVDAEIYLPVRQLPNPFPPPTTVPGFPLVQGNPGLVSETVMAYEAGIRVQPSEQFFWDLAVFFNQYENLRTYAFNGGIIPGFPIVIPGTLVNGGRAQTYGFEVANTYQITPRWRLTNAYTFLASAGTIGSENADTRNQLALQSGWDLGHNVQFDLIWRYVDSIESITSGGNVRPGVPSYTVMDVRLAWTPRRHLTLEVVGRNLLDGAHLESPSDQYLGTASTEVPAEVYGMVTWRY